MKVDGVDIDVEKTLCDSLERAALAAFDAQVELDWFKRAWPLVEKLATFKGPPVALMKRVKDLRAWLEANPKPEMPR